MIQQGTWVTIRCQILDASERAAGIPTDTAATPFMLWVKGTLLADAEIGQEVRVRTATGREEAGVLAEAETAYPVGYGAFVPELSGIGPQARALLFGGGEDA
ncbi:MAG: 2-amino-4-oxopentanoate thiolase subunit OrtA [Clostridiales bacterium]|nr:2-amino-4-oxopentanoate thiolase subunit OrtA [Clostridiales bacterium]